MTMSDVVIIGAGPYGLSIAAHLRAQRVDFRIFGRPMHTWRTQMPKGMLLKSEGFASSLYDPDSTFTLGQYCKSEGVPYADVGTPVPLETFIEYGLEFQRRFVPQVEEKLVVSVQRSTGGFEIFLDDGELVSTRRLVVAVGISHFHYLPPVLASLTEEFVTHSSRHNTLDHFKGRDVVVVGAGASALDLAALLHRAGAAVQVVARKPAIRFHDPARIPRPLMDRIQNPMTGIGPGWKLVFCAHAPLVFRQMPERFRLDAVRRILGPAPGWFIKKEVVGKVPFNLGVNITRTDVRNGRVRLDFADNAGVRRTLIADHIIAATGYRVDLRRLTFLDLDVQAGIRSVEQTPVLSSNFESSLPGLYFVGTSAANMFGPVLRFAFGARFTARRLARHLARLSAGNVAGCESVRKLEAEQRQEMYSR
jgi:cation diffusion facilitator CzcD-associated flavoprotein CzcO